MMLKNRISLFVATFLIIGFFFLALPEKGYSGINFGCCLSPPNGTTNCIGCLTDCTTSEAFCLSQGGIPDSALDNELCLADENGNNAVCGSFEGNNTGCCVFDTESANCQDNLSDEQCFNEGLVAELWFVQTPCSEVPQCEPPPQFINLSPATATNDVGTDHTVTATVDTDGVPEPDVLVTFEVISGPNAGEMSDPNSGECTPNNDCTTDANDEVSWTYSSLIPGTDTIVASIGDTDIESNIVEKIWESVPIPTLSEWGLLSLAVVLGILGIVGFMVIRRRKLTA